MTIEVLERQKCTGCGACAAHCPANAIVFCTDSEGFAYPWIDLEKCMECEACVSVCPSLSPQSTNYFDTQSGYLAVANDKELTHLSASGGAFAVLADYVLRDLNGVVIGACLDKDYIVRHHSTQTDIRPMQGSKYVQSCGTEDAYRQARDHLLRGQHVLFSGTPCQIAGLNNYLGQQYERLITMDLVCHGVSAPTAFRNYILYLERVQGRKIADYRFRNKTRYDKKGFVIKLMYTDGGQKWIPSDIDLFARSYLRGYLFRPCCYYCVYAQERRVSDITVGDCNSDFRYPEFHPTEAASIIMLNTKQAVLLWQSICQRFDLCPLDVGLEQRQNGQLNHPSPRPKRRDIVCSAFAAGNFAKTERIPEIHLSEKKWLRAYIRMLIPWHIRSKISTSVRTVLKRPCRTV